MRRSTQYLLLACGIALAMIQGCDWLNNPVGGVGSDGYNVRATVLSHTNGAPLYRAYVEVTETHDAAYTNDAGQTRWLATPARVDRCTLSASYGQITTSVVVGLSRNPTYNQATIYLSSKAPYPVPKWLRPEMLPKGAIFVPDQLGGGMIIEVR